MQIDYPCGCKAVVFASTHEQYINPVPYLHLCPDHKAEWYFKNRDLNRNIGIGV